MADPTGKSKAQKAAEAKALAAAKAKQSAAGSNTGGATNKRTFSGNASYVTKGKEVEEYATTPEQLARWEASSQTSKDQYKDKTNSVTQSVSDLGVNKPTAKKIVKKKASNGYYHKGSNMHNQTFGGKTTSGYSKSKPVGSKSFTASPDNPKSGKPNTFESRELTDRESKVQKSRFSSKAYNPYNNTEEERASYLGGVEKQQGIWDTKVSKKKQFKINKKAALMSLQGNKNKAK
jgi:hypothetical protein